jgi:hypothetical protein
MRMPNLDIRTSFGPAPMQVFVPRSASSSSPLPNIHHRCTNNGIGTQHRVTPTQPLSTRRFRRSNIKRSRYPISIFQVFLAPTIAAYPHLSPRIRRPYHEKYQRLIVPSSLFGYNGICFHPGLVWMSPYAQHTPLSCIRGSANA